MAGLFTESQHFWVVEEVEHHLPYGPVVAVEECQRAANLLAGAVRQARLLEAGKVVDAVDVELGLDHVLVVLPSHVRQHCPYEAHLVRYAVLQHTTDEVQSVAGRHSVKHLQYLRKLHHRAGFCVDVSFSSDRSSLCKRFDCAVVYLAWTSKATQIEPSNVQTLSDSSTCHFSPLNTYNRQTHANNSRSWSVVTLAKPKQASLAM